MSAYEMTTSDYSTAEFTDTELETISLITAEGADYGIATALDDDYSEVWFVVEQLSDGSYGMLYRSPFGKLDAIDYYAAYQWC